MILHIKGGIFLAEAVSGVRVALYKEKWGVIVHLRDQSPAFIECESEEEAWNAMNTFEQNWQQAQTERETAERARDKIFREWMLAVQQVSSAQTVMKKDIASLAKSFKDLKKAYEVQSK